MWCILFIPIVQWNKMSNFCGSFISFLFFFSSVDKFYNWMLQGPWPNRSWVYETNRSKEKNKNKKRQRWWTNCWVPMFGVLKFQGFYFQMLECGLNVVVVRSLVAVGFVIISFFDLDLRSITWTGKSIRIFRSPRTVWLIFKKGVI